MSKTELSIDVNVQVTISKEQAEKALRIVEWFLNDNKQYRLKEYKDYDKTVLGFIEVEK